VRVAVIGAGPNGLACAAHLAAAGVSVTVLEQSSSGFGGISSADGPLPGFRHDVCAGFFPLSVVAPALQPVLGAVDWVNPGTAMAHPFRDGTAISLERDVDATAAQLGPGGARYSAFMRRLVEAHGPLMQAALEPVPPGAAALDAARSLRLELARLAWRAALPAGFLGRRWLGDAHSAAWLAGSTAHSDLDPTSPGGGAFALVLQMLGHAVGWPFPRGGAQAIGEALAAQIRASGGEIRHGAAVEEILLDRGSGRPAAASGSGRGIRARGVRLRDGAEIEADAVISTLSAAPFLRLVPRDALPRGVAWRLRRWRYDAGTFKVDFALDAPVPWTAEACRRAGVVHVGDTLADFTRSLRAARAGEFPERPALVVGQHSLFDDSRAPAGRHTLYCYVRSPLALRIPAEQAAELVEAQIERFAPGFRATIAGRVVRSPGQMEEENPSMVGGDLGGGSYQLHQQLFLRPHPRLWRTLTPVPGLYFAGTSAHPGGGVHGTQGLSAARIVLARTR
jgi:phytoene dehydrogenase-like protein